MNKQKINIVPWLLMVMIVIVIDQISKNIIQQHLSLYEVIDVFPFFSWTLIYNEGAAFGFLSSAGGWQRWFFTIIAIFMSVFLVIWLSHLSKKEKWLAFALAMTLAGALGNLYDRIVLGHVVDFVLVHYKHQYHFPAFNVADSAITIGIFILMTDFFLSFRKKSNAA